MLCGLQGHEAPHAGMLTHIYALVTSTSTRNGRGNKNRCFLLPIMRCRLLCCGSSACTLLALLFFAWSLPGLEPFSTSRLPPDTYMRMVLPCVAVQRVHEVMPKLVEAADVADPAHHAVAAHWVSKSPAGGEAAAGTYVFKFDQQGLIIEITSYPDAAEDEFLEA